MKFIAFLAVALLTACAVNKDGSTSLGIVMSPAWHDYAPRADVNEHYDKMETHELCILWADSAKKTYIRKEISLSLRRRGLNPLLCY